MLFTDVHFIFIFMPLFLLGYFLCKQRLPWVIPLIFASSLVFHGLYSLTATLLLIFSILVNYGFLGKIYQNKRVLTTAIIFNLSILFYFKYVGFFADIMDDVFGYDLPRYHPALPLGISFFTFTQIACLVDSYREKIYHRTFMNYGSFVSYFPHLIAGPIIHYKPMVTQFLDHRSVHFRWDNFSQGLILFSLGLAKKIIIADTIAGYIDPVFKGISPSIELSTLDSWGLAIGYTFQLYFDFSGYTDMAIGMSRMVNIKLPPNFNSPYLATSLIDFWRRWHMSLSSFLKEYLYIPLGGSHKGPVRKHANLLITMLLGGLWHGAGYTYVLWGLWHGCGIVINHLARDLKISLPQPLNWVLTFLFVVQGWVVFRSPDMGVAVQLTKSMYTFQTGVPQISPPGLAFIAGIPPLYYVSCFLKKQALFSTVTTYHPSVPLFLAGLLFTFSLIMTTHDSPFLYFQF